MGFLVDARPYRVIAKRFNWLTSDGLMGAFDRVIHFT
jgi:hypothetical protein